MISVPSYMQLSDVAYKNGGPGFTKPRTYNAECYLQNIETGRVRCRRRGRCLKAILGG